MPAKIRLEVDNATRPGFNETSADLQKLADKLGITQDAAKGLKREMDNRAYAEYRKELRRQADELDGTAAKMREAAKEAEALKRAQQDAADAAREQARAAQDYQRGQQESLRAVVDVWGLLKDGAQMAGQAIVAAAEAGNESAKSLVREFTLAKESLARLGAESRTLENLFGRQGGAVDGLSVSFANAAKAADDYFARAQDGAKLAAVGLMEFLGLVEKGEMARQGAALKEKDDRRELEQFRKKELDAHKFAQEQIAEVRKKFETEERLAAEEKRALNLDDKKIQTEIILEISKREKTIKNIAILERLTAEEKKKEFEKEKERLGELLELLKKRQQAEKDAAQKSRERSAEEAKMTEEHQEAWRKNIAERQQKEREAAAAQSRLQMESMEAAERMREQFAAAVEQRRKAKLQQFGADNVGAAINSLDRNAVQRKVFSNRQEQAQAAANSFLNSDEAGDMSNAERIRRGREIYREKMKSFGKLSRADGEEVAAAQQALLGKQLDAAVSGGRASAEAARGFRDAVAAFQQQKQESDKIADDLAEVREFLAAAAGRQGRRGRDQKFGSR